MIWKAVKDYEGLYEVSDTGLVRSVDRIDCRGQKRKGRTLKWALDGPGYPQYKLSKDGRKRSVKGHRLVAEAFLPNPDCKTWVNHKNGDKTNNHDWNLEWSTPSENIQHAYDTGLAVRNYSKLTESEVLEIRTLLETTDISMRAIARRYGVTDMVIHGIRRNTLWRRIQLDTTA